MGVSIHICMLGSRWALTGDDGHGCVGIGVLEAVSGSIGLSLIGGVN